ncbi:MAG: YncE family protein [Cyanobacteriota bacterium]
MIIIKKLTKSVLILFCFLFIFASCSVPSEIITTAFVVVPNKNRVEVMNMSYNEAFDDLFTEEKPSSVAISPDEKLILVTNSGSGTVSAFFKKPNDTFQKLNSIGSGKNPQGIVFNPVFPEAYVAYEDDGKILVLDTKNTNISPSIISTIDIKGSTPKKMVTNKDGTKLFVTDSANRKLLVFTKTKNELIKKTEEISLIENPKYDVSNSTNFDGIAITKNEKIYISDYARDNILIVDTKKINEKPQVINLRNTDNNNLEDSYNIGPRNMTFYKTLSGKEKIYVVGYKASIVSSIDVQTSKVFNISLRKYKGNTGRDSYNPVGITVANFNGKDFIYVTNTSGLPLSIIDPETDRLQIYISIYDSRQEPYGEIVSCCSKSIEIKR